MNHIIKASLIGVIAALFVFAALFAFVAPAKANPSAFNRSASCQTAAATTTTVSMTAGTATTTITCDMQYATALASDSAVLEMQRTASSTQSITKIKFEYSMDNKDWYESHNATLDASTTPQLGFYSTPESYQWQFASSTMGALATSPAGQDSLVLPIRVPTRYVRAIITVPPLASSSLMWAEITGKKQNN